MLADDARARVRCGVMEDSGQHRAHQHAVSAVILVWLVACHGAWGATDARPEVIFQLPLAPAGLTVAPDGGFLLSVSFEEKPQNRIISVNKTGESKPYPTVPISQAAPGEALLLDAVQGLQCTDDGIAWMLDNGRRNELPPKVVAWDSSHSKLHRVFNLASPAVLPGSLVDDIAIDPEHPFAYLSDPAGGADAALIVLDTGTGLARRVLQGHPSVVPVAGLDLAINGQKLESKRLDGSLADPMGGVNPLALDKKGEWLYFGPLRSRKLYRVRTQHLRDPAISSDKLAGLVEEYATKPLCAGITLDGKGNVYVSDLTAKAIGMIATGSKEYRILATDPRFLWPDGLCFGADGKLYFYTNASRAFPRAARTSLPVAPEAQTNYLFRLQTPSSGRVGD
jgi:sugar lactone lactonase YvrE